MARRLEVLPGRDGRWFVRDGGRRFTVPAELAERLDGPGGEGLWRDLLARHAAVHGASARRVRGLWLRVTLLPGGLVRPVARRLIPLAATPALAALALAGVAALILTPRPSPVGAVSWPVILGVFLLTALAHELGHAAALSREGWPPGGVGVGLLWVLPVGWCDVSAVGLLPRRGRVRVDLAGVAFQLAAAGLVAISAAVLRRPAVALGAYAAVGAVVWSLLPLARTDGYWLACDLFDLPDLAAPIANRPGRGRRLAAAAWRTVTALLLLALLAALPWRLRAWLGPPRPDEPPLAVAARAALLVVLLVAAARTLHRVGRLLAAAWRDLPPKTP